MSSASDPVARLACPACGGKLPLPTAGTEYLTCPFCATNLQLRQTDTGLTLGLAEAIGTHVGAQVDRRFVGQQVQLHHIQAEQAYALGHTRAAVLGWIAAYDLDPQFAPARERLDSFIRVYQAGLTSSIVGELRDLNAADRSAVQTLNSNPVSQPPRLAAPPPKPPPLGSFSLSLLRRIAPHRATAVEAIHAERMAAYTAARVQHEQTVAQKTQAHTQACQAWSQQEQRIRQDRALMARLCLAVAEAEARRAEAEARRQALLEQQRQQAAQQAQQQQIQQLQQQIQQMNKQKRKR